MTTTAKPSQYASVDLKYNIELKNVKIFVPGSQETINFVADIHINGKHAGYANNEGQGGPTSVQSKDPQSREVLNQVEQYFGTLPKMQYQGMKTELTFQPTLDGYIDEIINDLFNEKERSKYEKKLQKDCEVGICFGSENHYAMAYWNDPRNTRKKIALAQMLTMPKGKETIVARIAEIRATLEEGERILNTNLPSEILA